MVIYNKESYATLQLLVTTRVNYHIAGKFGEFDESYLIRQTKTIQISIYNYNLLVESIHSPNFFCQMFKTSKSTKLLPRRTFLRYGISDCDQGLCNK